jgi:hypothetical protein
MKYEIITFGTDNKLTGIISQPKENNNQLPCVIFLNAGIVYRIGPNRIYHRLSKELNQLGFTTFRFDFSGIGDSSISLNENYEDYQVNECIEAIDLVEKIYNIKKFIIIGMCSGADVGFNVSLNTDRIVGLVSINGQFLKLIDNPDLLNKIAQHQIKLRYYKRNIFSLNRWMKIIQGKSKLFKNIYNIIFKPSNVKVVNNSEANITNLKSHWESLNNNGIHVFLIFSEGSVCYDLFKITSSEILNSLEKYKNLEYKFVKDVDHTFTLNWAQEYLFSLIYKWLQNKYVIK